MEYFIYIIACILIGTASYFLTKWGVSSMFVRRLKVSYTGDDGVKRSTTIKYEDGDDIDVILKEIRAAAKG